MNNQEELMIFGISVKYFITIFGIFAISALTPYMIMKYTERKKENE